MRKVADLEPMTLKQILLDAARYRWLRENVWAFYPDVASAEWSANPVEFDAEVDKCLAAAHE